MMPSPVLLAVLPGPPLLRLKSLAPITVAEDAVLCTLLPFPFLLLLLQLRELSDVVIQGLTDAGGGRVQALGGGQHTAPDSRVDEVPAQLPKQVTDGFHRDAWLVQAEVGHL